MKRTLLAPRAGAKTAGAFLAAILGLWCNATRTPAEAGAGSGRSFALRDALLVSAAERLSSHLRAGVSIDLPPNHPARLRRVTLTLDPPSEDDLLLAVAAPMACGPSNPGSNGDLSC